MAVRIKHFTMCARMTLWLTLLALMYVAIWLQGGARDMNWARPWVVQALNPSDAPYEISIGDLAIDWQDITDFGALSVKNMQIAQKGGAVFASIPSVDITLDPFGFLPRRRALHGIRIDGLHLAMLRDEAGIVRLGVEGVEGSLPLEEAIASFGSDSAASSEYRGRLPFRALTLENASLVFTDMKSNTTLQSTSFSLFLARRGYDMRGNLRLPFKYQDKPGSIDAGLYTQRVGDARLLTVRLQEVPAALVCMLASCPADYDFTGLISGKANLRQTPDEGVSGNFAVTTSNAKLTALTLFPKTLSLKNAALRGQIDDDFHRITVEELNLKFPDTDIAFAGMAAESEEGWHLSGKGAATNLSMKKLYKYWPLVVAPDTRSWVMEHITDGVAERGELTLDMQPEDITGDTMRDEALAATIHAKGIEVNYLPGFPPVKAMDGVVSFTGKTMNVDATSGSLLTDTVVKSALLACDNLDNPRAPMTTTLQLAAPAKDVASMLKLPAFTFDDGMNLDPATITGTVDATLKLGFDGFSEAPPGGADEVDFSNVSYDIQAVLNNVGQPKLLSGRDVSGLSGTLLANDKGVDFTGGVKLDGGTDVALTLKDADGTTMATAKGKLARRQFSQFGIPDVPQIGEGSVGIDAEVALGKTTEIKRVTVDLTPIALNIPEISYEKKAGAAASLSVAPAKAARSYSINAKAPDLQVSNATLQLSEAMEVASFTLGKLKTSRNDFGLSYKTTANGFDVNLAGARLDNSASFAAPSEGDSLLVDFPPINLTVDLGELVMVEKQPLRQVKGTLNCNRERCASADLSANAGAGKLDITIATVNGARRLMIHGSNAGDLLRATDVTDRMFGGTLEVRGGYDDSKTPPAFSGRLTIEKFKLKNSEILARIISIGSLSGLMNVLTGEGIDFKKLGADIDAQAGVFTVKKGRADSNALGLTVSGPMDMKKHTMNLKGVVVPANSLNSLFGKIPLIGKLAGEGDALIGFTYSVKGGMSDPDVFVNPLSGLTPGFLRNIFLQGDDSAPEPTQTPKPEGGEEKTPDIKLPAPAPTSR